MLFNAAVPLLLPSPSLPAAPLVPQLQVVKWDMGDILCCQAHNPIADAKATRGGGGGCGGALCVGQSNATTP